MTTCLRHSMPCGSFKLNQFSCPGDLSVVFAPLVESLASSAGEESLIEHSCGHWVLKRLLTADSNWTPQPGQGLYWEQGVHLFGGRSYCIGVYVLHILGICAISRLRCALCGFRSQNRFI